MKDGFHQMKVHLCKRLLQDGILADGVMECYNLSHSTPFGCFTSRKCRKIFILRHF